MTTVSTPLFDTVLIANRGEIACRVILTLRRLGIRSVAVYSDADADARHVHLADVAVRLGPANASESYLDIDAVLDAAAHTGAQAIHPGYGFLAENAAFAAACEQRGIVFIGPRSDSIAVMGDKISAKAAVEARGVPTVPGLAKPGLGDEELARAAIDVGFPILIKPSAGGGGKGMHVVENEEALRPALAAARREASASFGDDAIFIERYVLSPRHIEVQVIADAHGTVVHLGERECSLQRRHQKVIEEAPSPLLDADTRRRIGEAACETARSVGYRGAGTVEFIVAADRPDEFFFMEMNTRLQVEHPVTEMITGIDLVELQLRVAAGEALPLAQEDVHLNGHSFEARLYAEDPRAGFLPTGGVVRRVEHPSGDGIRVDTALENDLAVSTAYDPMLAKIITWAPTRELARRRLISALEETAVFGFTTNIEFLRLLLRVPDVAAGALDTGLIARELDGMSFAAPAPRHFAEAALLLARHEESDVAGAGGWARRDGWRLGAPAPRAYRLAVPDSDTVEVHVWGLSDAAQVAVAGAEPTPARAQLRDGRATVVVDGTARTFLVDVGTGSVDLLDLAATFAFREVPRARRGAEQSDANPPLTSPMPGTVVMVPGHDGAHVEAGEPLVIIEAMKMEHVMRAPVAGILTLHTTVGAQVRRGETVAIITADAASAVTEGAHP
ncbi:MAG: ATP-grasp domain-containing protein [Actinobacteria bacterium]|nr:ATP-grasp domain-containing protein [Actinomycetota bacterium]